jgi:hypothetical protein
MQVGTIFQIAALSLPEVYQQANRSITLLGITQDKPKWVKRALHRAEATSQWRRRWSIDFPFLLHMHHLSTIITCLFLRLFKVRILSRAADYAEKAALEGAWIYHTLFQGKRLPSEQANDLNKDLTMNKPLLEETHQSLYSLSLLTMIECRIWKKEAKTSASQSCASLEKLTFHWLESPKSSKLATIEASFAQAIPNKPRKRFLKNNIPHHRSCQNLAFAPSPTSNLKKLENVSHPFLMFFHNPTPKEPTSLGEHHPPQKLPNLESTATLHQSSLSLP